MLVYARPNLSHPPQRSMLDPFWPCDPIDTDFGGGRSLTQALDLFRFDPDDALHHCLTEVRTFDLTSFEFRASQ